MTRPAGLKILARDTLLGGAAGILCGAASALFLHLLHAATDFRLAHSSIIYALPAAGLALGWMIERFGNPIRGGNNLIIDAIHDGGPEIPLRMAPMVLAGTVLTHLFGGSAGREGTAVQMGGSLAAALARRIRAGTALRRRLLAAGAAGGFGSVFGTPAAGAIFGLEFTFAGRIEYAALLPALAASLTGDLTARLLRVTHAPYPEVPVLAVTALLLVKWIVFAGAMAAAAAAFIELTHAVKRLGERWIPRAPVRMAAAGGLIVVIWRAGGADDYLGLGVEGILRAFSDPEFPAYGFAVKLALTALTLGAGFQGGEVTPLFFIGAALGNVMARILNLPLPLGAGVGMAAVFAAASNTPLALTAMAVELMGAAILPHVLWVCAVAYALTGHRSIYPAQRLHAPKAGEGIYEKPVTIREAERTRTRE